jgi:uncharacterized protein
MPLGPQRVTFEVEDSVVRGELYRPTSSEPYPCLVMANGFSGTMDWILPSFAARFAGAGLAVLAFDYRHLGKSDGEPRQVVDVKKQRADLRAAIEFARRQSSVDPARIGLWGTSLGGSHVTEAAADDPRIAAVVLNMPALDAIAGANIGAKRKRLKASRVATVLTALRLLVAASSDGVRAVLGRPPRYVAVYGNRGEAFFTDPDLAANFARLQAGSPTWQNRVAARFLLHLPRYREGTMERIAAPILVCLAEDDLEVSAEYVKSKAARAKSAEVRVYPVGHFAMYHGEAFERVVADQLEFLRANLLVSGVQSTPASP